MLSGAIEPAAVALSTLLSPPLQEPRGQVVRGWLLCRRFCSGGRSRTPGTSGGFTLSGPALAKGTDAEISLKVKQLPNVPQVTFKVVQTYSDGEVVRWIELPGPDGKEPDNPAPVVKLTAGAASALSPKPANDTDEDAGAAKTGSGSLARTGAADRPLAVAAGLLLLAGGWAVACGAGPRRRFGLRA